MVGFRGTSIGRLSGWMTRFGAEAWTVVLDAGAPLATQSARSTRHDCLTRSTSIDVSSRTRGASRDAWAGRYTRSLCRSKAWPFRQFFDHAFAMGVFQSLSEYDRWMVSMSCTAV